MKPDKNRARGIGFYMLIGVIILAVVFYLTTPVEQKEYTYSEIETLFREEKVKSFSLEGDELTLNLYSKRPCRTRTGSARIWATSLMRRPPAVC